MHTPNLSLAPTLETARLTLRLPLPADFDRYAELQADEESTRYIGGAMTRAAAWRRFLQMPGAWVLQGFAMFSVIERASGRWIGQTGPWQPEGWNGTEVGFVFHRDAWGQGYAFEAANAAIDFAFEQLKWQEVIHNIDPDNLGSIRLAERLGSSYRGPGRLPEPYAESRTSIWAQTREAWLQRNAVRYSGS